MDQAPIATQEAHDTDGISVRVDTHRNPILAMSQEDRMRLFIRVLCELVAYDEPETD